MFGKKYGLGRWRFIILLSVLFLGLISSSIKFVQAESSVTIYLFYSDSCPHCHDERVFLQELIKEYPLVSLREFEVVNSVYNQRLFAQVSQKMGNSQGLVPFLVIGERSLLGYYNEAVTGSQIEGLVQVSLASPCRDIVGEIISPLKITPTPGDCPETGEVERETKFNLPFWGEVEAGQFSLPLLTVVLGFLDGFNPCAMWALMFLITLLLGMEDKRRRWLLGLVFISVSGFVYFLFMTAWLNLFLFLGWVVWIRILVGSVALTAGFYNLRDFWVNKSGSCQVGDAEKKKNFFEKLKKIVERENLWWSLVGIAFLAVAVNMIELVCSAGLPAIYTQVLSLNDLSAWQYYLYLVIYIFFFMLDDFLVFGLAMISLQAVGMQGKYSRFSRLIGGILILLIGLLLLFKPEWLSFA